MSGPNNLYDPIKYILGLGGKRIRPILTLMSTEIFDGDYKSAMPAAMAVEMFHNFSLIHDDIMDDAPLRRGNETVHEKWDLNTGILSGDAMLILAYRFFECYEPETFRSLAKLFSKTALEVCEGQQLDVDFEVRNDVTIKEYLTMIANKTAVLLGAAMKMGGIVAKTTEKNCDLIYEFGKTVGIAFQIQDDYLDAFGDPETFGKQVGGDIIENKKTYLYLKAVSLADIKQSENISAIFKNDLPDKVDAAKKIFHETGAADATLDAIEKYTANAFLILDQIDISSDKKKQLKEFGEYLMRRKI